MFDTVLNAPLSTYRRKHPFAWVFLKISQNSQENNCIGVPFLIKLQVSCTYLFTYPD